MQLKNLIADDDAVSPVIGVILMVAITVILAAVIGTFVLGLGDQVGNNAPSAQIGFEFNNVGDANLTNDEVVATHESGQQLTPDSLEASVGGQLYWKAGQNASAEGYNKTLKGEGWSSDPITAGDQLTISEGNGRDDEAVDAFGAGDEVRIVWSSDSGDTSTIAKREIA